MRDNDTLFIRFTQTLDYDVNVAAYGAVFEALLFATRASNTAAWETFRRFHHQNPGSYFLNEQCKYHSNIGHGLCLLIKTGTSLLNLY